jgi:glycerol-3-phosphate cytidylyltransferase-like family protein
LIDLEAYEHDQQKITEIGIAVLSTSNIMEVDAGIDGSAWFTHMKHMHIRPQEHRHLHNKMFIKGCADAFDFGKSNFVALSDCRKVLDRVFADPSRLEEATNFDVPIDDVKPNIIFVGHDIKNDTDYLKKMNFAVSNVVLRADTQRLATPTKKNQPGLKRLLRALNIDAKNLHNAGNDAAYTLQALLSLVVREHHEPGSVGQAVLAVQFENQGKCKTFKAAKAAASAAKAASSKAAVSNAAVSNAAALGPKPQRPQLNRVVDAVVVPPAARLPVTPGGHVATKREMSTSAGARRQDANGHESRRARNTRKRQEKKAELHRAP